MDKALATAHQAEDEREALRHFRMRWRNTPSSTPSSSPSSEPRNRSPRRRPSPRPWRRSAPRPSRETSSGRRSSPSSGGSSRSSSRARMRSTRARRSSRETRGTEKDSVPVVVRVNAEYPLGAPRSTVPPSVLLTLPPLPASPPLPVRRPGPHPGRLRGPAHRGLPAGRRARSRDQVTPMNHAMISRLLVVALAGSLSSPDRALGAATRGPGARHPHAHPAPRRTAPSDSR